jgi:hypothetical protein
MSRDSEGGLLIAGGICAVVAVLVAPHAREYAETLSSPAKAGIAVAVFLAIMIVQALATPPRRH